MLTEYQVIQHVCRFLEQQGFEITSRLTEMEKGVDIQALSPGTKRLVSIEAKGETSSKPDTQRYGKPFDDRQGLDHVAKAMYCAARDSSSALTGIALPKNTVHVKHAAKVLHALQKLEIEIF